VDQLNLPMAMLPDDLVVVIEVLKQMDTVRVYSAPFEDSSSSSMESSSYYDDSSSYGGSGSSEWLREGVLYYDSASWLVKVGEGCGDDPDWMEENDSDECVMFEVQNAWLTAM